MRIKRAILISLVIVIAARLEYPGSTENAGSQSKDTTGVKNKDVEVIISQVLSCPAWSEIERDDIRMKSNIMKSLASVAENDIFMIREAIAVLLNKHPQDASIWSRIFLLNRYIFQVPERSPIDRKLFGGWAGVPIENGIVNRLWPFSYDSQNKLQLVGEFEGYYGDGYRGLEEFDHFQKTYGSRRK